MSLSKVVRLASATVALSVTLFAGAANAYSSSELEVWVGMHEKGNWHSHAYPNSKPLARKAADAVSECRTQGYTKKTLSKKEWDYLKDANDNDQEWWLKFNFVWGLLQNCPNQPPQAGNKVENTATGTGGEGGNASSNQGQGQHQGQGQDQKAISGSTASGVGFGGDSSSEAASDSNSNSNSSAVGTGTGGNSDQSQTANGGKGGSVGNVEGSTSSANNGGISSSTKNSYDNRSIDFDATAYQNSNGGQFGCRADQRVDGVGGQALAYTARVDSKGSAINIGGSIDDISGSFGLGRNKLVVNGSKVVADCARLAEDASAFSGVLLQKLQERDPNSNFNGNINQNVLRVEGSTGAVPPAPAPVAPPTSLPPVFVNPPTIPQG